MQPNSKIFPDCRHKIRFSKFKGYHGGMPIHFFIFIWQKSTLRIFNFAPIKNAIFYNKLLKKKEAAPNLELFFLYKLNNVKCLINLNCNFIQYLPILKINTFE